MTTYFCPRCGEEVDLINHSEGYFASCATCDEDFYKFELAVDNI